MKALFERFADAVEDVAGLHGYPYPERRQAWLDRLRTNLPELQAIESLAPEPDLGYLAPRCAPPSAALRADVPPAPDAATAVPAAGPQGADAALAALAQARRHADLNAFISLADPAMLQRQAEQASQARRDGARLPLLHLPIAIKDLMAVAGFAQTNGSGMPAPAAATRDALAVARLRQAGALIIGTTNLHELAYGITSANPHFGAVGNPRHPGHTPGGSSGGSAAAVAAGIVRIAVGTDTAGSIRYPAACCGVVGFKPSFDAVPRDGAQTLGASLDHLGPIAAGVADAALAYAVMAGQPVRGPHAAPLAGRRVGVPRRYFYEPLADDVAAALDAALELLRGDGAELVPVDIAGIETSAGLQFITLCSEATDLHWDRLLRHPATLGEDVRVRLEAGQFLPAIWYTRAQRGRAALVRAMDAALAQVDVLVTPTMRTAPTARQAATVTIGARQYPLHTATTALTMPFNLAGLPALTLPCGASPAGLPISMQVVGARGADWHVLDIAARIETLVAGRYPAGA
ncbi:amidase [Bordetella petrii]|uniref:amidase n=1 Tax=Bordetella petrii TaxID=94624 RepID=UPI001A963931|nr:amidase [Bordetella petrii]MBO1110520.1 amidase [Bordetella petrii]